MLNRYWLLLVLSFSFAAQADVITNKVLHLEQELGGHVGFAMLDMGSGKVTGIHTQRRFPMMSTFKSLACASLLFEVDNNQHSLDDTVIVKEAALVSYSPIISKLVGKTVTLQQVCEASVLWSDNTAANMVLEKIGGPAGFTTFMRQLGDKVTRLDRIEPELNQTLAGDLRDTTSPEAIVTSLAELIFGQTLSVSSREQLENWMLNSKNTGKLFRSSLPAGWRIADKTGYGENGSRGITAIVWPPAQSPKIIALYFTQTRASLAELNQAIFEVGQLLFQQLKKGKGADD